MQNLFPPKPSGLPAGITEPSAAFKKEVIKVFFLCVVFFVLYLLLLACTIGIAILFGFLGILLVSEVHGVITLMLALGAIGMGVMLVYFMLKSLAIKKNEPITTVGEITQNTDPVLYNFISKVCAETKAPSPKKIFLIDDVNAFVSYDSVLLSLFFPARKNLYIGLGLINSSTVSELKAVIAHEFGHFSQGSMRFSSYVYHFNQIIYKMVADNAEYNASLEKWAGFSGYFALFARLNVGLIRAVQSIMSAFYKVLNKGYMGLARQMEFHADAVAASVAGSAPLITNLYRMELAKASYDHLLAYYNGLVKENIKADNLFTHHFKLMQLLALRENIQLKNGFPIIDAGTVSQLGGSSIVIKDQWASHPSDEDRESALRKLNIVSETIDESAWMLFSNPDATQAEHSERLYEGVSFSPDAVVLSIEEFELKYQDLLRLKNFQPEYNGYYNNRYISCFELNLSDYTPEDISMDSLFSKEWLRVPKTVSRMENDILILDSISAEGADYKSFDFEGLRYPIEDAFSIKNHLNKELKADRAKLREHDQEIYYIARRNASVKGLQNELENAFQLMFSQVNRTEADISLYNELMQEVAPAYSRLPYDEIKVLVMKIIHKEKQLKERICEILENERILQVSEFREDIEHIQALNSSSHVYFTHGKYLEEQLDLLNLASNAFLNITTGYCFMVKKEALEMQLKLLQAQTLEVER